VLFERRFWDGIASGAVTLTFRRWKRRQAVAGSRHRTPAGIIEVEAVEVVDPADVTDAEAGHAGYRSAAELLADLRGTPDLPLYRVRFAPVAGPDPRAELAAAADLDEQAASEIDRRLERLDRASSTGPWTVDTLALIAEHPATRAAELAVKVGRETQDFKLDVRKLKNLGLTLSLQRGYRLSPRGEAYLRRLTDRPR
jgi:hypothetical protein